MSQRLVGHVIVLSTLSSGNCAAGVGIAKMSGALRFFRHLRVRCRQVQRVQRPAACWLCAISRDGRGKARTCIHSEMPEHYMSDSAHASIIGIGRAMCPQSTIARGACKRKPNQHRAREWSCRCMCPWRGHSVRLLPPLFFGCLLSVLFALGKPPGECIDQRCRSQLQCAAACLQHHQCRCLASPGCLIAASSAALPIAGSRATSALPAARLPFSGRSAACLPAAVALIPAALAAGSF